MHACILYMLYMYTCTRLCAIVIGTLTRFSIHATYKHPPSSPKTKTVICILSDSEDARNPCSQAPSGEGGLGSACAPAWFTVDSLHPNTLKP